MTDAPNSESRSHQAPDAATDEPTGAVCWLEAVCTECGAMIEGGTCWNCGARRTVDGETGGLT